MARSDEVESRDAEKELLVEREQELQYKPEAAKKGTPSLLVVFIFC
jgi:hypothetical protein